MSTLVSASVPAEQFVLAETFERLPAVEFDAVGLVGEPADGDVPLLRARGAAAPAVRDALEADAATASVDLVTRLDRRSLFRVRWTARARLLTAVLVRDGGAVLSARGTSDGWSLRILFPERDAVSVTCGCGAYDLSVDWIRSLDPQAPPDETRLTDTQFETLEAALESGYYGVPRGVAIEELAAELGVSHQALSERLRRGHRALVERVLGA